MIFQNVRSIRVQRSICVTLPRGVQCEGGEVG
uniref:Uncharacterized protein n=1 Tax=Anguilla anguilla TaxID=7936 RepID=A0A0E9VLQ7_ANGAN